MLLMIDNYDSFTYNLVQYFSQLGQSVEVVRNDMTSLKEIEKLKPEFLVISPGPCTPKEAGVSVEAISHFKGRMPILGVCLGHQCIGSAFGAEIVRAKELMHGKLSTIQHDGSGIFKKMPLDFMAARYHSLVIEPETLTSDFIISESASFISIPKTYLKNYLIIVYLNLSLWIQDGTASQLQAKKYVVWP